VTFGKEVLLKTSTEVQDRSDRARINLEGALRKLRQEPPEGVVKTVSMLLMGALGSIERAIEVLRR